jgi:hypothetical protein
MIALASVIASPLCVYALRARPQCSLIKSNKKRSFLHPVTSLGLLHLQETAFRHRNVYSLVYALNNDSCNARVNFSVDFVNYQFVTFMVE